MLRRAVIGKGGHAREVKALLQYPIDLFTDEEFLLQNYEQFEIIVAIGDPKVRKNVVNKFNGKVKFFTYVHPTCVIGRDVEIGEGSFIGPFCVLTTNIKLGDHSLLLRANHIGHDTQVGEYLSMMGGAIISGNCSVGSNLYMGNNSSIKEKISICDDVVLGMNGCVIRNVVNPGTYVGVPCEQVK